MNFPNSPTNNPKANVIQLSRPLYAPLEYKLRLALKSVSATIVRAYSLKTAQQKDDWMLNVVGNRAIIETWIDVSQLTGENSIQRVVERGIQVPEYGVKISCGSIKLHDDQESDSPPRGINNAGAGEGRRPKKVYKLIHVWACVGRPFITEAKEGELVIPNGYDSVYLQPSEEPENDLTQDDTLHSTQYGGIFGERGQQTPQAQNSLNNSLLPPQSTSEDYHHKFIVYDSDKLFADYLIYLEYSPDADDILRESLTATLDFGADRRLSMHSVRSTASLVDPLGQNSIVQQAYQSILQNLAQKQAELQDDPLPVLMENDEQRQSVDTLKDQLEELEQRREQICQNAMEVENQLRDQFKRALLELHDITQLKLSKLCSTEVDLTRRIQELQWMNQFMDYQREILDPLSFVESYSHHSTIKEQKVQQLETALDQADEMFDSVTPDIQCAGELKVESLTERITEQMKSNRQIVLLNAPNQQNERGRGLFGQRGSLQQSEAPSANGPLDEEALKRGECVIS